MKRIFLLLLCVLLVLPMTAYADDTQILGDSNGDGKITAADAALILRSIVKLEKLSGAGWYAADANQNGKVDAADAALVLRSIVKLDRLEGTVAIPPMISNLRWASLPTNVLLDIGDQVSLAAVYDLNGAAQPNLVFSCSNPTAFQFNSLGNGCTVTAVQAGSTIVTVLDPVSRCELGITFTVINRETDVLYQQIYANLRVTNPDAWIGPVFEHISSLNPNSSYYRTLLEGMKLLGKTYKEYNCTEFIDAAFKNAGVTILPLDGTSFPKGSASTQLSKYKSKDIAYELAPNSYTGQFDLSMLSPGSLLFWTDRSGSGNHIAFYLGTINGVDFLLESASGANGVAIRPNWGNNVSSYTLKYWVAPLG